ncbi:hypothetical protein LP420_29785 [Massilia sp. B-10]|nr:hypothetical protein LP420_29785 [Massilia sp. B-10]
MNTEQPGAEGAEPLRQEQVPETRSKFRALVLSNPNYFGNVEVSPFPPVLSIKLNTTYEEIGCVGFQPQFNRLDAVIYINQPTYYGGGICGPGTPEYVRFYTSSDNGATWQDAGLTSFTAWDIPVKHGRQPPPRIRCHAQHQSQQALLLHSEHCPGARDSVLERAAAAERAELHSGLGRHPQYAHPDRSAHPDHLQRHPAASPDQAAAGAGRHSRPRFAGRGQAAQAHVGARTGGPVQGAGS